MVVRGPQFDTPGSFYKCGNLFFCGATRYPYYKNRVVILPKGLDLLLIQSVEIYFLK